MKEIAIRYGLIMLGGFIAFFLLMHLFGLSANSNLRIFNGVIHLSAIYFAIRQYNNTKNSQQFNYLSEVAVGMCTSFLGVVGFTIFMIIFLSFNPSLLEMIRTSHPNLKEYLTPFTTSIFIFVEGITISLIGSYLIARVFELIRVKHI